MKNFNNMIILIIFVLSLTINFCQAEDVIISVTPTEIVDATDKNGNSFKRIVFSEDKVLNGIKYKSSSIIIAFRDVIEETKKIELNKLNKLIVSKSEYKGRDSYTLLAVVK